MPFPPWTKTSNATQRQSPDPNPQLLPICKLLLVVSFCGWPSRAEARARLALARENSGTFSRLRRCSRSGEGPARTSSSGDAGLPMTLASPAPFRPHLSGMDARLGALISQM